MFLLKHLLIWSNKPQNVVNRLLRKFENGEWVGILKDSFCHFKSDFHCQMFCHIPFWTGNWLEIIFHGVLHLPAASVILVCKNRISTNFQLIQNMYVVLKN